MDDFETKEDTQLAETITQPTRATQPLLTTNINPNLFAKAPTGIATLNQGLTPTEQALLSPEEQAIRLRSRGLA